jgi:TPP-dependent pyruvate/acetoin dehydrogenase alpha subunit
MSGTSTVLQRRLLREMLRIRVIEELIAERYPEQEMRCPTHLCIGQEAVAVGVCAALERSDWMLSGHRSHGHYLAKGGDLFRMLAEIFGRAEGCSGGKGGSMHLVDLDAGVLGAVPIVASTIPIAVGAALTAKLRGERRVAVVFFGDAAAEAGVTHEAMNYAALERLPVVFVCENNLYSVQTPLADRQPAGRAIHELAAAHGVESRAGDGNDVLEVFALATAAVEKARDGGGPTFLELSTYRWLEHVGPFEDHGLGYRSLEEIALWKARCPIAALRRRLLARAGASEDELESWRGGLRAEAESALEQARLAPFPDPGELLSGVYRGSSSPIDGAHDE